MHEETDEQLDDIEVELANFEPEGLTLERVKEMHKEREAIEELARSGQFGFQILMMHPEGHVQMASDLNNLVQYWLDKHHESGNCGGVG